MAKRTGTSGKITYINPYPSVILYYLDYICQCWCIKPFRVFFDHFLCSFFPTTIEVKNIHRWRLGRIYRAVLSLTGAFLMLPLAICGVICWLIFQWCKEPYRISICDNNIFSKNLKTNNNLGRSGSMNDDILTYKFATVNTCLLHECMCRFNNMTSPDVRGKQIGERIIKSQCNSSRYVTSKSAINHIDNGFVNQKKSKTAPSKHVHFEEKTTETNRKHINHTVLEQFPEIDILFVQEAWVNEYAEILGKELHACFPYIIYDAGVYSWRSNYFSTNSGLMIASKYPVLNVKFDWYRQSTSQCRLASKGLLQVKVLLGEENGKKLVGYVYNTHLQVYQGVKPIQSNQMDSMVKWSKCFRKSTLNPDDVVVFDIMGGDFNSDNMSPVDRDNWYHPLFTIYKDVCRERPGKDFHWTVGTEMRHTPLHDQQIQTPYGLKEAIENPALLQYYVLDAVVEVSNYSLAWLMPQQDKKGKQKLNSRGGKRRIDFLLHRAKDEYVKAVAINPVTQLASLTDHISYCLTIEVPLKKLFVKNS